MDIFYSHFSNIRGNLYHVPGTDNYEMFPESTVGRHGYHINYTSFKAAFEELSKMKDPVIIETGSSRWGVNSTILFDSYVRKYGGRFWSVDIHQPTTNYLSGQVCPATTMVCNDSVAFLKDWVASNPDKQANFVYLDSWDIDWFAPEPAEKHGLTEFEAIRPALKPSSVLLIDDTPADPYWTDDRSTNYTHLVNVYNDKGELPGKGHLVVNTLKDDPSFHKIHHMYQVMWKCI
jgi:hypothetical protein